MTEQKNRIGTAAKWILGLAGACVTLALQTPPDVVSSNAALWVEAVTGHLPVWPQSVDTWLSGLAIIVMLTPLWVWLWRRYRKPTMDDWLRTAEQRNGKTWVEHAAELDSPPEPGSLMALLRKQAADHDYFGDALPDRTLLRHGAYSDEQLSEIGVQPSLREWVPLDDAIRYLGEKSQWATQFSPSDPKLSIHVGQAMRDALVCGDIDARGRKYHELRGGIQDPPLHPLEPIEAEFWKNNYLDAYWPLQGRVQMVASQGVENVVRSQDHEGIHDIRLDRAAVEQLWPKREQAPNEQAKRENADSAIFDIALNDLEKDRVPYVRIRHIAHEYGLDFGSGDAHASNLAYKLEGELRQAAFDGNLRAWGRKYKGPVQSNDPIALIPPSHFADYEFSHGYLHYETDNWHTHTGVIGKELNQLAGEVYYDLRLCYSEMRTVLKRFTEGLQSEQSRS